MRKIVIIICIVLVMACLNIRKKEKLVIPTNSIRFRIVANSNSKYDQDLKIKLNLEVQKYISDITDGIDNKKDFYKELKNNKKNIQNKINEILNEENYNEDYKVLLGENFFPEKKYNDITYKKGYYDSLIITLGKGLGSNWWCVLFPPLCLMETEKDNIDKVEYKFFIKELIDKYI